MLRLASLLWRLRRATTMETGLFEIQADHIWVSSGKPRQVLPVSREVVHTLFARADSDCLDRDPAAHRRLFSSLFRSGLSPLSWDRRLTDMFHWPGSKIP